MIMIYSYIRPVYIDRRHYVVTGEFPVYSVTEDQGKSYTVRWTGEHGLALTTQSLT